MFVKPAPGLKVRHPQTPLRFLADAGEEVSDTDPYWIRRLRDRDVEIVRPEPANGGEPA